ncbi:MAG: squalene cyclase [Nitrospirae bacterium]|nr:squalene cyclase [Nitrospirota bacterium]
MIVDIFSETVRKAKEFLLRESKSGFPETRHVMYFPHQAGFTGETEKQFSDVFARAVLANILLDIAGLEEQDEQFRATLHDIAQRESLYIAEAKLRDRAGGWSYFPDLPDLPPDVDSLAAAALLFARIAPEYKPLCEEPVNIVLNSNISQDHSVKTWIIAPTNTDIQRQTMIRGIDQYWGNTVDVEVCANFYLALLAYDRQCYGKLVLKGAKYILSRQSDNGVWNSTWYWGYAYGTGLCLRLMHALKTGDDSVKRAIHFFMESQKHDGGWGWDTRQTVPLETALAVWLIVHSGIDIKQTIIERAAEYIISNQSQDGSWDASPWIKMEVGRVNDNLKHTLSYQSITLTTAYCLRSLLLVQKSGFRKKL